MPTERIIVSIIGSLEKLIRDTRYALQAFVKGEETIRNTPEKLQKDDVKLLAEVSLRDEYE